MMRTAMVGVLMAGIAALAMAVQDQRGKAPLNPPGPRPKEACELKKIEQAPFCEQCVQLLDDAALQKHKTEQDYKSHKIGKAKACVREFYHCDMHPENDSFDKGQCCGKDKVKVVSRWLVNWVCETCGTPTNTDKECPRNKQGECPKAKLRMECTYSPNFPHTNERLWREQHKADN